MNYVRTSDAQQTEAVRTLAAALSATGDLHLEGVDEPLPPAVAAMLREIVSKLAAGEPVALITASAEMTPNEAAEFLKVSRGTITKLMDEGVLPFHAVGTHRRIPSAAVAAHKAAQEVKFNAAMDELVSISEELGLYDHEGPPPPKSYFKGTGGDNR